MSLMLPPGDYRVEFWTNALSYVNLAGAVHALVQALLLWCVPRGRRAANRIMAAFLVVLAIGMSHGVALLAGVYERWPPLVLLMGTLPLLYGPLFFFYVRAMARQEARWQAADAFHLAPFILGLAAYAVSWRSGGPAADWRVVDSIARAPWQAVVAMATLQTVVYVRWIRRLLRQHSDAVKSSYSHIDKVTLGWLRWRLATFGLIWTAGIVMMAVVAFEPRAVGLATQLVFVLVALNTFATGYRSMVQPVFFGLADAARPAPRYERSSLTPENAALCQARLLELMERDKPFLDPEITLPALAQALDVQPAHLSRVINELLGRNFFEFVNRYRVETAKRRLSAPGAAGEKLITVALECGFNSLSTFNRVFKDIAGRTPSDYRRNPASQPDSPDPVG
jgi:AraC-like DNA-binding protein